LEDNGGCDLNATCKNIQGGFECSCKEGYSGNGFNCQPTPTIPNDKDENNSAVGIGVGIGVGVLALCSINDLNFFF